jgi:hypothetical protein
MAERTADMRTGAAFLGRWWRVLVVAAVVGLALGVVYARQVAPQLTSTAKVLVRGGGGSTDSGDSAIATQVQIILSTPVLQRAGRTLAPPRSAREVRDAIQVEGITNELITIQASSTQARQAEALAQSVAQAYITTLKETAASVTGETMRALQERDTQLTTQLKQMQEEIDRTKERLGSAASNLSGAREDAQTLSRLVADQSALALEREKVRDSLESAGTLASAASTGTLVQPAAPAEGPDPVQRTILWAFSGALVLAALAAGALWIKQRRDPRLRLRDDLADAVGSSVLADVRSRPQRSVAEWTALLETYQAAPVDAWAFRQILRALATAQDPGIGGWIRGRRGSGRLEHPVSVTIVSLSGDRRGLAVGPQLAAFAAGLGLTTRLLVATGHDSAPSLWAACSSDRRTGLRPGLRLEVGSDDEARVALGPPQETFDELLAGSPAVVEPVGSPAEPGEDATSEQPTTTSEPAAGSESGTESLESPTEEVDEVEEVEEAEEAEEGEGAEEAEEVEEVEEVGPRILAPAPLHVVPRHTADDLTIVVAVVDRGEPTLQDVAATAVTALAISPGVGTREDLARLAVAVDDADRRIDGLVIADPDSTDWTTGRRTLDERARHVPLPVRMTGISSMPGSEVERESTR